MTKVMIALAVLMAGVLTLGMSQRAVAAEGLEVEPVVAVDLYERGLDLLNGRNGQPADVAQALALFEQLAAADWVIAQYRLGEIYDRGQGVARDRVAAYRWYRRAADRQFAAALERLEGLAAEMTPAELAAAGAVPGRVVAGL